MKKLRYIFAVHKWETTIDKHIVNWTTTGTMKNRDTEYFDDWDEALIFAVKKYKEIDGEQLQIDCPNHVHENIL